MLKAKKFQEQIPHAVRAVQPHRHDVRCEGCGRIFDLLTARVGMRTLENTLGELPDHQNPWAECPHCGYVN